VHGTGDELLAGPALGFEEDRELRAGNALDTAKDLRERHGHRGKHGERDAARSVVRTE